MWSSTGVSYWLGAGADPNGLSSDQQSTALTAAVSNRRRGVLKVSERGRGGAQSGAEREACAVGWARMV